MVGSDAYWNKTTADIRRFPGKSPMTLTTLGRITVLLLTVAGADLAVAQVADGRDWHIYEFTSDFRTPLGVSRFDGLMATDGVRHRIAIYWVEPRIIRDSPHFVCAGDLLFTEDAVHYWVPGMLKPDMLRAGDNRADALAPREDDVPSVVRSALAIVGASRRESEPNSPALNLHEFLQQSRAGLEYRREYTPGGANEIDILSETVTDRQLLNTLPLGRRYKKEAMADGSLKWQLTKVLNRRFVAGAIVRPVGTVDDVVSSDTFDAETLGHWTRVPEPYRVYWSLRADCSEISASAGPPTRTADVYDRITSYLENCRMPDRVRRATEYLGVQAAFATGDLGHVRRALQTMVTGLCHDDAIAHYEALLQLADVADTMEAEHPGQFEPVLEPLVAQMVDHMGQEIVECLDRLIRSLSANKRFRFGGIVFETVCRQPFGETPGVRALVTRYEAARLATEKKPFDPSKASATVRQYLAQFAGGPPKGSLSLDDIRHILETGLILPDDDSGTDRKARLVADVLTSLRLIVGSGPFRGDRARLTRGVERFSHVYFLVCRNTEPIHPALTTFLALSFYDTSTPADHDALCDQAREIGARLERRMNALIAQWNLRALVTCEDVNGIVRKYCEMEFRFYVDDPLCPTFKFPLTETEKTRLINKVELGFDRLEPLFDEMSLKVKYGGVSARLKARTMGMISHVIQDLLPTAAFLRRPSYLGCVYQYRGRQGFAGIIPETAYQAEGRPKEEFKAMRYFHLGHRLDGVDEPGVVQAGTASAPSSPEIVPSGG